MTAARGLLLVDQKLEQEANLLHLRTCSAFGGPNPVLTLYALANAAL